MSKPRVWKRFEIQESVSQSTGPPKVSALADSYFSNRFHTRGLLIALMMEAARTSEMLGNFYQTTRRYNPEDSNLRTHRRENLNSYLCSQEPTTNIYVKVNFISIYKFFINTLTVAYIYYTSL
jgi:hypothetical protein